MVDIDWSKAPEGFPVWVESHYRYDPSDWHVKVEKGYKDRKGGLWFDHQVENGECTIHVRPEWTGEGLPPVGTVCEVSNRRINRTEVTIRYVGEERVIAHDGTDERCFLINETTFHPIRTAGQIAAEERENAIHDLMGTTCITMGEAAKIYDAGYRKQVAK